LRAAIILKLVTRWGGVLCLALEQWRIQKFENGEEAECISLFVICHKCTQRTICYLYGKRRLIENKILSQ